MEQKAVEAYVESGGKARGGGFPRTMYLRSKRGGYVTRHLVQGENRQTWKMAGYGLAKRDFEVVEKKVYDDHLWVMRYRQPISRLVYDLEDCDVLKAIAKLVGYDPEPEKGAER